LFSSFPSLPFQHNASPLGMNNGMENGLTNRRMTTIAGNGRRTITIEETVKTVDSSGRLHTTTTTTTRFPKNTSIQESRTNALENKQSFTQNSQQSEIDLINRSHRNQLENSELDHRSSISSKSPRKVIPIIDLTEDDITEKDIIRNNKHLSSDEKVIETTSSHITSEESASIQRPQALRTTATDDIEFVDLGTPPSNSRRFHPYQSSNNSNEFSNNKVITKLRHSQL